MRKLFTGEGGGWLALNFVTNIPLYHYGIITSMLNLLSFNTVGMSEVC